MRKPLAVGLLILVFSGTSKTQSNPSAFYDKAERFSNYDKDFISFATADNNDKQEHEAARELGEIAGDASERLSSAGFLVEIYDRLSCPEDRASIRPVIEGEFSIYKKLMDNSIDDANLNVASTQKPAVAAEGIHMRDELREAENLLKFDPSPRK